MLSYVCRQAAITFAICSSECSRCSSQNRRSLFYCRCNRRAVLVERERSASLLPPFFGGRGDARVGTGGGSRCSRRWNSETRGGVLSPWCRRPVKHKPAAVAVTRDGGRRSFTGGKLQPKPAPPGFFFKKSASASNMALISAFFYFIAIICATFARLLCLTPLPCLCSR